MKRSALDRTLAAIDVGLQSAEPDPTFGEVSPTITGLCWRCEVADPLPDSTSGVCEDCRTELLAEKPCEVGETLTAEQAAAGLAAFARSSSSFGAAFSELGERMVELARSVTVAIEALPEDARATLLDAAQRHLDAQP